MTPGAAGEGTGAGILVRRATRADLDALVALEGVFPGDRIPRAAFARFMDGGADAWLAERAGAVVGRR